MYLVLLGPPGVGKGTEAELLAEKFSITHLSTGDMLREAVARKTEAGKAASAYMLKGELVPDEIVIGLFREVVGGAGNGFVLDGFPRNRPQAESLEETLRGEGINLTAVISLKADDAILISRLSGRRQCRDCDAIYHLGNYPPKSEGVCDKCGGELYQRKDDREEAIRERLAVYQEQTPQLLDYYGEKGLLEKISANDTSQETFVRICDILQKKKTS